MLPPELKKFYRKAVGLFFKVTDMGIEATRAHPVDEKRAGIYGDIILNSQLMSELIVCEVMGMGV